MKWVLILLVGVVAAMVVIRLLVAFFGPQTPRSIGVVTAGGNAEDASLTECPATPNCHVIKHPVNTAQVSGNGQLIEHLAKTVSENKGKIVSLNDTYLHATFTSTLFGFVDDFECLLIPGPGSAKAAGAGDEEVAGVLQCRSASRLGHSDLGVNRKRIETILRQAGIRDFSSSLS